MRAVREFETRIPVTKELGIVLPAYHLIRT
jgi:hypothetical protein